MGETEPLEHRDTDRIFASKLEHCSVPECITCLEGFILANSYT